MGEVFEAGFCLGQRDRAGLGARADVFVDVKCLRERFEGYICGYYSLCEVYEIPTNRLRSIVVKHEGEDRIPYSKNCETGEIVRTPDHKWRQVLWEVWRTHQGEKSSG